MTGKRILALFTAFVLSLGAFAEEGDLILGDMRPDVYLPVLEGRRIALLSNQTGLAGTTADAPHILDVMLEQGLDVNTVFSPEHGFRGTADAGEKVGSDVDPETGVEILSLYGGKIDIHSPEVLDRFDVLVVDIQDVGLRFYTYYVTMFKLMDACAAGGKKVVVFDRPNPNGSYVDGPVLDMKYASGVGRLPITVVHGMTLGELARMIIGEGWMQTKEIPEDFLTVIPCLNYTHQTRYALPVAPSPNLKDMKAVYLYPSTCFFEGTKVSLGRGTDWPFEIYGHPDMKGCSFTFTPESVPGAKRPPLLGLLCHGVDLRGLEDEAVIAGGVNFSYVIDAYRKLGCPEDFFGSGRFFDRLAGNGWIRRMIVDGASAEDLKRAWEPDVKQFLQQRRPYLLYEE
ncbi:MAG: DUF1343 domain-containing protein [Bacteroidales bacterium]|nr:DUF1343 domain-containing protein [Bacteroidales bacterium]